MSIKEIFRKKHVCGCCGHADIYMERHLQNERIIFALLCPACGFSVAKRAALQDAAGQAEAAEMVSRIFSRKL